MLHVILSHHIIMNKCSCLMCAKGTKLGVARRLLEFVVVKFTPHALPAGIDQCCRLEANLTFYHIRAAICQNVRFSVADEIEKSAIKVCSIHDRTTRVFLLLFARSLFFLDRKFCLRWRLRSIYLLSADQSTSY